VKKGARGTTAYFFKRIEISDPRQNAEHGEEGKTRHIPLLRAFTLFHASQIEGTPELIPPTAAEAPWRAPDAADTIITNSGVAVRIGGDRAFYALKTDHIQMPPRHVFHSAEGWCSTVLHELSHATGHPSRLNRDLRNAFGSPDYAREELRALSGQPAPG
jgi:antirestriction protein ArdC